MTKEDGKEADFHPRLARYKQAIDADISAYAQHVRSATRSQYGDAVATVTDAYLDMLERGGKRIRGALVMTGYEMCGGTDRAMIVRAATAMEMIHTYLLIIDDIQDRSAVRRGQPTVHKQLAAFHHKHGLKGDAAHSGLSLALNAALAGGHAAHMLLAGLNAAPELKVKVLGIINYTMIVTAHGQTTDIMNELVAEPQEKDITDALEWKAAHYTILNPLCVGMVLAGAGCEDTDAIRTYALETGKAFQITDDIMGIFGDDERTGKNAMDDMREGKQTIVMMHAMAHASPKDRAFLRRSLGSRILDRGTFERAREIIRATGALDLSLDEARQTVATARASLRREAHRWPAHYIAFLDQLAGTLLSRVR